jgi:hypothetical protein
LSAGKMEVKKPYMQERYLCVEYTDMYKVV